MSTGDYIDRDRTEEATCDEKLDKKVKEGERNSTGNEKYQGNLFLSATCKIYIPIVILHLIIKQDDNFQTGEFL